MNSMDPDRVTRRHIEIKDGDATVAAADVSTPEEEQAPSRASLRAASGHVAPGRRTELVDSVLDLPEVQGGRRLEAAVPLGDGESLDRLRAGLDDMSTRPAGSTALVDGTIPRHPAEPSAADPSAAEPSPAQPSAAQPSPAQPSAAQPSAAQPSAAQRLGEVD
jgi:hypothetical protein